MSAIRSLYKFCPAFLVKMAVGFWVFLSPNLGLSQETIRVSPTRVIWTDPVDQIVYSYDSADPEANFFKSHNICVAKGEVGVSGAPRGFRIAADIEASLTSRLDRLIKSPLGQALPDKFDDEENRFKAFWTSRYSSTIVFYGFFASARSDGSDSVRMLGTGLTEKLPVVCRASHRPHAPFPPYICGGYRREGHGSVGFLIFGDSESDARLNAYNEAMNLNARITNLWCGKTPLD